jgi:hypothetical protein
MTGHIAERDIGCGLATNVSLPAPTRVRTVFHWQYWWVPEQSGYS